MNPESAPMVSDRESEDETTSGENRRVAEVVRRQISLLVNSGRLTPEQAEKLAKLQITGRIEEIQEQAEQVFEDGLTKVARGVVDFGEDRDGNRVTMKVFEPKTEEWTPKFFLAKNGKFFNVGFISNSGSEFLDPLNSQAVTDNDLENPDVQAAVKVERVRLNVHLEREKAKHHNPPKRREEFRETEYSVDIMCEIAKLLNRQESLGRGLLVVEGEAGTGKNWMVDHIAHLTERPVFRFTCDGSKETPELKYILEFVTDEKGSRTVRINSTIIEALQTEGAILEFDEINTLRPDVAKSLNSLFDADRALYYGEDDLKVRAAQGVLIIGLMNPSNYAGVKPLAETIKSRARLMKVDYPPFVDRDENGDEIKRPDEAEMVYQYFPEFHGLSRSDFEVLWHQVVNGRENRNAQIIINQARQLRLIQLKTLVNTASHIREAYRQYQEGGSGSLINYNFTLRESADCAMDLADDRLPSTEQEAENRVREVVANIFVPKLDDPEEKKNATVLISEA